MAIKIEHLLEPITADQPLGHDGRQPVNLKSGGRPDPEFPTVDQLRTVIENSFQSGRELRWGEIRAAGERLLTEGSKNLEAAFFWSLAALETEGIPGFAAGLHLMHQLLEKHWETLPPLPDAGDPYERSNIIGALGIHAAEDMGPYRVLYRLGQQRVGQGDWTVSQALAAADPKRWPRSGSIPHRGKVADDWRTLPDPVRLELTSDFAMARNAVRGLDLVFAARAAGKTRPQLGELDAVLTAISGLLTEASTSQSATSDSPGVTAEASTTGGNESLSPSAGRWDRRAAMDALEQVRRYFQAAEPANPVIPLMHWAGRIKDRALFQSLEEFSPETLGNLERLVWGDVRSPASPDPLGSETGSQSPLIVPSLPIRSREEALAVMEAVISLLKTVDPCSPVLTLVELARRATGLRYLEICRNLEKAKLEEILPLLGGKPKDGSAGK